MCCFRGGPFRDADFYSGFTRGKRRKLFTLAYQDTPFDFGTTAIRNQTRIFAFTLVDKNKINLKYEM